MLSQAHSSLSSQQNTPSQILLTKAIILNSSPKDIIAIYRHQIRHKRVAVGNHLWRLQHTVMQAHLQTCNAFNHDVPLVVRKLIEFVSISEGSRFGEEVIAQAKLFLRNRVDQKNLLMKLFDFMKQNIHHNAHRLFLRYFHEQFLAMPHTVYDALCRYINGAKQVGFRFIISIPESDNTHGISLSDISHWIFVREIVHKDVKGEGNLKIEANQLIWTIPQAEAKKGGISGVRSAFLATLKEYICLTEEEEMAANGMIDLLHLENTPSIHSQVEQTNSTSNEAVAVPRQETRKRQRSTLAIEIDVEMEGSAAKLVTLTQEPTPADNAQPQDRMPPQRQQQLNRQDNAVTLSSFHGSPWARVQTSHAAMQAAHDRWPTDEPKEDIPCVILL